MASFTYYVPEDFLAELAEKLGDIDDYALTMIEESMPIIARNMQTVMSKFANTGDLMRSQKIRKARKLKNGTYYANLAYEGESDEFINDKNERKTRKTPIRNAEKLIYFEYGTSDQSPHPIIDAVVSNSEEEVLAKMQEIFNREALGE